MITAALGDDSQSVGDEQARQRARAAMLAVAEGLAGQGLDVLGQEWEGSHCLKATNAWRALCEATIAEDGAFTWEYRAATGTWADPAQITAMTLTLLDANDTAPVPGTLLMRYPGQTFMSAVGLTARACGMHARLGHVSAHHDLLEISTDVEVTNPARPGRGVVHVTDTALRWECRIASPETGAAGLPAWEITETIGRSVPQLSTGRIAPAPAMLP